MSIRAKVLFALGTLFLVEVLFVSLMAQGSILKGFVGIENQNVSRNISRLLNAIDDKVGELNVKLSDWARWDDTYAFIVDHNDAYLSSNLNVQAFQDLKIDVMVFFDASGNVVKGERVEKSTLSELALPVGLVDLVHEHGMVSGTMDGRSSWSGVISLPEGPFLFSMQPIVNSAGDAPPRGALLFGKFIDSEFVRQMADLTRLDVVLYRFDTAGLPADVVRSKALLADDAKNGLVIAPNENQIYGYGMIDDVFGKHSIVARIGMPRDIYKEGRQAIVLFLQLFLFGGGIIGLLVFFLLERLVLSRLARLSREVADIGHGKSEQGYVSVPGHDEIAVLAGEVNRTFAALRQSETRYRESEERFDRLADTAPLFLWLLDIDGRATYVNKRWVDFTGLEQSTLIGDGWLRCMHPEDMLRYQDAYDDACEKKMLFSGDYRFRRRDGEFRNVLVRSVPRFSEEKVFVGYFNSGIDAPDRQPMMGERKRVVSFSEKLKKTIVPRMKKTVAERIPDFEVGNQGLTKISIVDPVKKTRKKKTSIDSLS